MEHKKIDVLVVEDEPTMAFLLQNLLKQLGYRVIHSVKSGEEAIEKVHQQKPDIILMDINLEGEMTGIQAAEKILEHYQIPVIYSTADGDEETIQNAKSTYPLGYILKPYNKSVLKSTIEVALSIKEMESKKNEELRKAYDTITYQTNELLESFNSAKEIQKAILPEEAEFKAMFPNSFIFNSPKEMLGGDFFWFKKISEFETLFGVVDCTGHGVPGALMSILVNYQLSKSLSQLKYPFRLCDMLYFIDRSLTDSLKERDEFGIQYDSSGEIHDLNAGFDAALCYYNSSTMELRYCGAKRPLYLIRDGELIVHKGNRASVGLFYLEEKNFEEQTIELMEGDKIYLFSDGFIDQIGGPKEKRFKSRNFQNLLKLIHENPPQLQCSTLQATFKKWKGINEQMDDIMILGMIF